MKRLFGVTVFLFFFVFSIGIAGSAESDLWSLYESVLKKCKYVDLTNAFNPNISVWPGFGHGEFKPAVAGADIPGYIEKGQEFTYAKHGFIATAYSLLTDQYGTQLDPPAHWDEFGATISDLPATYAIRPLVVIDIHEKVAVDPGYHCSVDDIKPWTRTRRQTLKGSTG